MIGILRMRAKIVHGVELERNVPLWYRCGYGGFGLMVGCRGQTTRRMPLSPLRAPVSGMQMGETALHAAAKIVELAIIKYLIQEGATVNLRNQVRHGMWRRRGLLVWILRS